MTPPGPYDNFIRGHVHINRPSARLTGIKAGKEFGKLCLDIYWEIRILNFFRVSDFEIRNEDGGKIRWEKGFHFHDAPWN